MDVPRRIAVLGMGVSGIAVAEAARALDLEPIAFDERPNDSPSAIRATDRLTAFGIEAVTGWHGKIDPVDFDVLVLSPGFPDDHPAVAAMLAAGKPVWGEIEFGYRIAKAPIIAITGTNGKSTTTVLAWMLAEAAGRKARLCGNIAGSGYPGSALSTAALSAGPEEVLVAEISSFQLAFAPTFRALAATVTNVSPDHFDRHPGFEHYYEAKLRLFANSNHDDLAVVNVDEERPRIEDVRLRHAGRVCSVSPSGARSSDGATAYQGGRMVLSGLELDPMQTIALETPHNVANAMVAWELVSVLGNPGQAGINALQGFRGLAHRMERLGELKGVLFVNNSMCTNPAAFVSSSRGLSRPQHILLGGAPKGLDFAPVAQYLAEISHKVYLFGPDPEHWRAVLGPVPAFDSLADAFGAALGVAKAGEAVFLCPGGASAEPYANFRERGEHFRELVAEVVR
ncbi:MAG: UDP-N-acetylmuramoyl-L-alanine--D-glutamate ligase [Fimbriimonadaceae bacterium]